MQNAVILKSFSSGISIIMDSEIPFEELLMNIGEKFKESDRFFKDASVAISLEGRVCTEEEERRILDVISANSRIHILCLMGKDEDKNLKFLGIQNNLSFQKDENCGQFYRGSLKDGQSIETENSIVILGDVNKGCSVYSAKDIVVLGKLSGEAFAGATGKSSHYIVALEMDAENLKIGEYEKVPEKAKTSKWSLKKQMPQTPKIAYTYNGEIVINEITKEVLESFTI